MISETLRTRIHDARWVLLAAAIALLALSLAVGGFTPFSIGFAILDWVLIALVALFVPRRNKIQKKRSSILAATKEIRPSPEVTAFASALDEPTYILKPDGVLVFANEGAQNTFGSARIGAPLLFKFRQPEVANLVEAALAKVEAMQGEYAERYPTERHFSVSVAPIFFQQTAKTGAKAESKKKALLFAVRFHDRSDFRATETMRTDFVANASHELRTPLSSLSGIIETLRGPARNDVAAHAKFLDVMQDQTERMIRLVDDLLSLSRIEMKLHKQPTDRVHLNEVIAHMADAMEPLAQEAGVELNIAKIEQDLHILGARDELVQVFENLVDNAIKYGRAGKRVDLTVNLETSEELYPLSVSVKDYGEGIDAIHLQRLPERFYRADIEASKKQKGTGLGLAIVKHILNRHRARLEILSDPGQGAEFIVWFSSDTIL